ncbi:MAG: hypothetical protein JOY65_14070, partial [Acetobacteraceae bacterium]|nr:hypothetical protein [Acetobacteraceae bacterium]
ETLRALVEIVSAIARQAPTALLFEDAHWADPTTLETMDRLVYRVRSLPLLVVVTHRPEFSPRWMHHGHVTTLSLSKLTRPQGAAMVSRLAGGKPLPAGLLERILDKADGVPLFVEELTKSILESADLRDAGDRWEYAGPAGTLAIPLTLRDSLMARLDRVAPAREVAQIGAAIGREFGYALIAAAASCSRQELDQALAQLTASGLAFQQGTPPEAVYTFKHALVRDAAYESLLKQRRQELHGKIARAIEKCFPDTAATEPELLAHHHTEAGQPERAIPLWLRAGSLALRRMALAEAVAHLNRGLELVAALAPSAERDGLELDLRLALRTAWRALRGWAAPELWESLYPALGLACALGRADALLSILRSLYNSVLTTGRVAESLRWATQIMEAAEAHHDPDFRIGGHLSLANSYLHLGELTKAREHADQVLSLYTEERHGNLVDVLGTEMKTTALIIASRAIWMLGFPERAVRVSEECEGHARRRGHAFNLAYVLTLGTSVFNYLSQPDEVLRRAEEAERLGRDNRLPFVTGALVPIHSGIALIRRGQVSEGIASLRAGLAFWEATGGRSDTPYHKSVLAAGMAQLGDLDGALSLIEEVIAQVERPGWEARYYYAETLRIRGGILARKGDMEGAERNHVASLDWARRQQAKSFELRTATSYARLLRDQGRVGKAHDLLAPIHGWFTEGFGTQDLREAKALLDELAAARGRSPVAAMLAQ